MYEEEEGEECEEDEEEEVEQEESGTQDDDEEDIGEMKSKFDKIMANFLEDNKKSKVSDKENEGDKDIQDFKNKNAQNNMKGIFQKILEGKSIQDEETQAIVHGPNKENNEMSVNIEITNKKMFPSNDTNKMGKPPTNPIAFKNVTNENINTNNRVPIK